MKITDDDPWKPLIAPVAVISGSEPILQVALDEEADWMALGAETDDADDEETDDDFDCISLEEALALDPTLASLPDMQRGQCAWREKVGDEWVIG